MEATILAGTSRHRLTGSVVHRLLIISGIIASLYYAVMNVIVPMYYPGYDIASYTVSELSAIDTPTRTLWVSLVFFYTVLVIFFGAGMWIDSANNKNLRIAAILMIVYGVSGFFWPPMHQRKVIAAGGGSFTDTMHIIFAVFTIVLMMLMMFFAARAFSRRFKYFTVFTFILFIIFGIFTGIEGPKLDKDLPTPLLGVWERINIGLFLLWSIVLATQLLKNQRTPEPVS